MTPGEQLEALFWDLQRSDRDWHHWIIARRLNRAEVLENIQQKRAILDRMERIVNGGNQ